MKFSGMLDMVKCYLISRRFGKEVAGEVQLLVGTVADRVTLFTIVLFVSLRHINVHVDDAVAFIGILVFYTKL